MFKKNHSLIKLVVILFFFAQSIMASSGACFRFYNANITDYIKFLGQVKVIPLSPFFADRNKTSKKFSVSKSQIPESVKSLASAVEPFSANTKLALYPASGFDGNTVFTVLKNVTTVVGIDQHGFIDRSVSTITPKFTLSERSQKQGWVKYTEIDQEKFVGADLVGTILSLGSRVRILSVTSVYARDGSSHGIIEFDYGESTSTHRYIHIQATNVSEVVLPILDKAVDAVFLKASMEFFDNSINPANQVVIEQLEKNHGLLVDGDGVMSFVLWPYLDKESEVSKRQKITNSPKIINTHIQKIGYDEAYLVQF